MTTDPTGMEATGTDAPDAETPDTEVPDAETPDAETPDTEDAEVADAADAEAPDTETPDTEAPDTETKAERAGGAPLTQSTGRRKESIARLRLRSGSGTITVNGRPFEQYFATPAHRMEATEPLRVIEGAEERYDVEVTITGGGINGQAGAMRMALARSLAEYEPEHRIDLKHAGLLTRDARRKESKKYGLVKARKAKQFTKR